MLKKEEILHLSKLARLGLNSEEIKKFQKELSVILDYVNQLKKVDVSDIDSFIFSQLATVIKRGDELREDEPSEKKIKAREKISEELLLSSSCRENRYFKTKSVFE